MPLEDAHLARMEVPLPLDLLSLRIACAQPARMEMAAHAHLAELVAHLQQGLLLSTLVWQPHQLPFYKTEIHKWSMETWYGHGVTTA